MLQAIDTVYNDYKFRSRLEARWAIIFDALHIPYEYEKEGYKLEGTWYLPDFWLPTEDCFFEVKSISPSLEELNKARLLSTLSGKAVHITPRNLWIPTINSSLHGEDEFFRGLEEYFLITYSLQDSKTIIGESYICQCPKCKQVGFLSRYRVQYSICAYCKIQLSFVTPQITQGFIKARQARFEHKAQ